jgi:uncharacterized protein (TIGR00725 family)
MPIRPVIAIIGDSNIEGHEDKKIFAEGMGKLIIDSGFRLQTGGMGGVMEAAGRGARSSIKWQDGDVISIIPGFDSGEAHQYSDIVIPTGMGYARNTLVVQADAVVAIGGGPGTLSEMALAWNYSRLIIARRGAGWSGKLADTSLDERRKRYEDIADDRVYGVDTPEDAMALLLELMPLYRKRSACIPKRAW